MTGKKNQRKSAYGTKDRHVIRFAGARVVIEDGIVKEIEDLTTNYCPLYDRAYGIKFLTKDTIRSMVEQNIRKFGTYTERRALDHEDFVLFGASEMIMTVMMRGILDSAVIACDGAGTVVTNNPYLVQGIGARLTGIEKTSPVPKVIEKLEAKGASVLNPLDATINQAKGVCKAADSGYKKIAVTVTGREAQEVIKIRKIEKEKGVNVVIFAVHNTGISLQDAEILANHADIVWGCASKTVREIVGPKALLQEGMAIPVFAITETGKGILLARAEALKEPLVILKAKLPTLTVERSPKPLT